MVLALAHMCENKLLVLETGNVGIMYLGFFFFGLCGKDRNDDFLDFRPA